MNKEIMRRNYEKTPKETLINILISSRETIQNRNKEIERLNNNIKELLKENGNKEKVIKAQDSIIKEVREYMALNIRVKLNEEFGETMQYKTIYEILDKGGK